MYFIKNLFFATLIFASTVVEKVQSLDKIRIPDGILPDFEEGEVIKTFPGGPKGRIIGGSEVTVAGMYPWYTALFVFVNGARYLFCGGTKISSEFILTAAHCTFPELETNGVAWIGFLTFDEGNGGQAYDFVLIDKVYNHPSYNDETFDNDIALLKLSAPATTNPPLDMDSKGIADDYSTGKTLTTIGMGCTTSDLQNSPTRLKQTELNYVENDQCTTSPYYWLESLITDSMICAVGDGTTSICPGDSGSALYDKDEDVIVGVTSFFNSNDPTWRGTPNGFARVSYQYENFIKPTVCSNSSFDKPAFCDAPVTDPPTESPSKAPVEPPTIRPVATPTLPPVFNPPTPTPPTGPTKTHAPTICEMNYSLTLMTDEYPEETSWEILDYQTGEVVASSDSSAPYPKSSFIDESGCLPLNCYIFTIKDSFGDGLCCGHGYGSYSLVVKDQYIAYGSTSFKKRETTLFGTCKSVEY